MKKYLKSSILTFVMSLAATGTISASSDTGSYHRTDCPLDQRLVCQLTDSNYIQSFITQYPVSVVSYLTEIHAYLLCVAPGYDADSIASLALLNTQVEYCHRDYEFDLPEVVQGSQPFVDRPGDENQFIQQPAAQKLNLPQVDSLPSGARVKIGIIDVGVDLGHPLLSTSVVPGIDYVSGDNVAQDEPNGSASGHGTFVAGLVHRIAPDAEIIPYRVLDTNGRGTGWQVAVAITQAIADSCKVINLSLVMHEEHICVDQAIELAKELDIVVVAAAGNDSSSARRFPANDSYVIGVTAVDLSNQLASFANYGNHIDVCAPGVDLYAPFPDSAFASWSGTSFAAPLVAAQAALLFSLKPNATWNEIVDAIRSTATNIDYLNPSIDPGSLGDGLINITASVGALGLICGDLDGSGSVSDVVDLSELVDNLFISFSEIPNPALSDFNGDESIDILDLAILVDHLFISFQPLNCGFGL